MKTELNVVTEPMPDSFAQAMSIGAKREEQLCDLIGQCYASTDTYPQAIVGITQEVKNINELVYAIFHLGCFAGNEQAKHEMIDALQG